MKDILLLPFIAILGLSPSQEQKPQVNDSIQKQEVKTDISKLKTSDQKSN